jgi:hypothetical protein
MDSIPAIPVIGEVAKMKSNETIKIVAISICIGILTAELVKGILNDTIIPFVLILMEYNVFYIGYKKSLAAANGSVKRLIEIGGDLVFKLLYWSIAFYIIYLAFKFIVRIDPLMNQVQVGQKIVSYVNTHLNNPNQNSSSKANVYTSPS